MQRRTITGLMGAICLTLSLGFTACGGDDSTGGAGTDGGGSAADAGLVDTGGGGGGGGDVVAPTPDVPAPTPDVTHTVPDAEWADGADPFDSIGGKPQDPVGRTGWACSSDSDCMAEPEHRCLFGFCTERCRDSTGNLPNACNTISNQSIYGQQWGCPTDMSFCMPGNVQNKAVICTGPNHCEYLDETLGCRGAIWLGDTIVEGVCLPSLGGKAVGEPCEAFTECDSNLCTNMPTSQGFQRFCSQHCEVNEECGATGLCVGIGFDTQSAGTSTAWAGMCSYTDGSQDYCTCQDGETCSMSCDDDGEYCREFINPGTENLTAYYWCVAGIEGAGDVNADCVNSEDCATGACYWSSNMSLGTTGYCAQPCPGGDADCPDGMRCGKRFLHNAGTPGENGDDPTFKVCLRGEEGDPCEVSSKDWCAGDLECVQNPDWSTNFGLCTAPEPDCVEAADCVDGLDCQEAACTDGVCSYAVVDGYCQIDGACLEAEATDGDNTCVTCDPTVATDAWTPVDDGTACDDEDLCTSGETCQAGACTPETTVDCDDVIDCTDDVCTDGVCDNPLSADSCYIDATCYADGDASVDDPCMLCDPATATDAWTPAACCASCAAENACGDDGCGGSCGECADEEVCDAGVCGPPCVPDCTDKACGDDGCGGDCGACPDDDDPCTAPTCTEGVCGLSGAEGCCLTTAQCPDDGNPCTEALCDAGTCAQQALEGCCHAPACPDDGDPCTTPVCVDDACSSTPTVGCCTGDADCPGDGDPCTTSVCTANACEVVPVEGCCATASDCADDDDLCTTATCVGNVCGQEAVAGCCSSTDDCADDGDACTTATCVGNVCTQQAIPSCCTEAADCPDEGDACTTATCVANSCTQEAIPGCCISGDDCEAGETCTDGACVAACVPLADCGDVSCGDIDDGCDGTLACGTCGDGETCTDGACVADCVPATECDAAITCGDIDDGCGGTVACGICGDGETCTEGTCVAECTPSCGDVICSDDGCGGLCGACTTDGATAVDISGFAFAPAHITVASGTTVVWTNLDSATHSVESMTPEGGIDAAGPLDSPSMGQDDTFSFTFDTVGVFEYRCGPHPSMTGSVTVE